MRTGKSSAKRAKTEPRKKLKLSQKQKRILAIVVAVVLLFGIGYGRTIFKLQAENRNLKKQQKELTAEKKDLTKELKSIHSKDYIKDQARKQLRLLDKDEKLFIFKGEDDD